MNRKLLVVFASAMALMSFEVKGQPEAAVVASVDAASSRGLNTLRVRQKDKGVRRKALEDTGCTISNDDVKSRSNCANAMSQTAKARHAKGRNSSKGGKSEESSNSPASSKGKTGLHPTRSELVKETEKAVMDEIFQMEIGDFDGGGFFSLEYEYGRGVDGKGTRRGKRSKGKGGTLSSKSSSKSASKSSRSLV